MQALVLYQSRQGHTRTAAEAIGATIREQGHHTVKVKAVIEVQPADVEQADVLFIGTWTQGLILFGVKPAEARLWVPALPSLAGKPTGVFCTYAFNPRNCLHQLGSLLTERGAQIVGQMAFHRSKPGEGALSFVHTVLKAAR